MQLIKLRGILKGFFFLLRADLLVPARIFNFLAHMAMLTKWIHKHKKGIFHDFYTFKRVHTKRQSLYEHIINSEQLEAPIDYLEFGVSTGKSFRWWTGRIKNPEARFHGFDTFTGLPEDWGPYKAGDMGTGNAPPEIDDNRHTWHQGLFQQTLIPFLKSYDSTSGRKKVIHLDADLYSATWYVLSLMTPYINKGDVIIFDEFNVPMHEFKAFTEWVDSFYIKYTVLGGVNNFYQVAIRVD